MSDRVRFAVVGLGTGRGRARELAAAPHCELVAVADVDEQRARSLGSELGVDWHLSYEDVLSRKDVDAVVLCTPNGMHGQMAAQAAAVGKHVLCARPLEISLARADEMISACRRAGVKLGVLVTTRHFAPFVAGRGAVVGGRLGEVFLAEVSVRLAVPREFYSGSPWRGSWEMEGGGVLLNQGHDFLDALLWMLGDASRVWARTLTAVHDIATEDLAAGVVELEGRALATVTVTGAVGAAGGTRLALYGSKDAFVIENGRTAHVPAGLPEEGAVRGPMEDFALAVLEDREPAVSGEEGRRTLELALAMYESSRRGTAVELPLPPKPGVVF